MQDNNNQQNWEEVIGLSWSNWSFLASIRRINCLAMFVVPTVGANWRNPVVPTNCFRRI
jgi:hypothetical protein